MSENSNFESESIAEARRRHKGKPPVVGHGQVLRSQANVLGGHGRPMSGMERFNSRFGDFRRGG